MRVLFIGNSYTLYNDVPSQVAALAGSLPDPFAIEVDASLQGGSNLKMHWHELGSADVLREGDFTDVVLQDNSTAVFFMSDDFDAYIDRFAGLARETDTRVWLYQTWARHKDHSLYDTSFLKLGRKPATMTRKVRERYERAGERIGADVVPVGDVWQRAIDIDPTIPLFDEDLHHAAPTGGHLSAIVFASTFTRQTMATASYRPDEVSEAQSQWLKTLVDREG